MRTPWCRDRLGLLVLGALDNLEAVAPLIERRAGGRSLELLEENATLRDITAVWLQISRVKPARSSSSFQLERSACRASAMDRVNIGSGIGLLESPRTTSDFSSAVRVSSAIAVRCVAGALRRQELPLWARLSPPNRRGSFGPARCAHGFSDGCRALLHPNRFAHGLPTLEDDV